MKPYIYTAARYRSTSETPYATLAEALEQANIAINNDDEWPLSIKHEGHAIWEQSGPMTTRKTLKALAEKVRVKWID